MAGRGPLGVGRIVQVWMGRLGWKPAIVHGASIRGGEPALHADVTVFGSSVEQPAVVLSGLPEFVEGSTVDENTPPCWRWPPRD